MSRQSIERFSLRSAFAGVADQAPLVLQPRRAALTRPLDMRVLELLTARLCHELSGPIAAINNGVELLADEPAAGAGGEDPDFAQGALALVGDSAHRAANRLQFYRFAYGFGRGGGAVGSSPGDLASLLFDGTRIICDYAESTRALSLDGQKLACNLLLVGAEALSGRGNLAMRDGPAGLELKATGKTAVLSPEESAALVLAIPVEALTSRTVQPYFTGLLAEALGCRLIRAAEPGQIRLTTVSLAD
jgi:histidine phosphotransferase ChpT